MMKRPFAYLLTAFTLCAAVQAADHTYKPPPASEYADVETHANEGVSIAADPFDTEERAHFFRLDYLKHDILPILITITNTGDRPIKLDDVRIQFVSATNDRIPAALPEEIDRRMNDTRNPMDRKLKLPIPLPAPKGPNKKIDQDMADYGFNAFAVQPHTTESGFLFYDVNGLDKPVLRAAQIYVKMIHGADGKDLFPFTIDLDKQANATASH